MLLLFKLAWRNLLRHRGKTMVIGTILFIGSLVMTIGNGVISGLDQGMARNIVARFSGNGVLMSAAQQNESILMSMTGQTVEPITHYLALKSTLAKLPYVKETLPAGVGYVWVLNETGQPIDQYLLGVQFEAYHHFFGNNLTLLSGRPLQPGEKAVMVSAKMQEMLYDMSNYWVLPQTGTLDVKTLPTEAKAEGVANLDIRRELVFMGLSRKNASLDILSPVVGLFKFKAFNSLLGFYSIIDIESLRECMGYYTADDKAATVNAEAQTLLAKTDNDIESLFSTAALDTAAQTGKVDLSALSGTSALQSAIPANWEDGIFNVIFFKTMDGRLSDRQLAKINAYLKQHDTGLKAVRWSTAIGAIGQMAVVMKAILFVVVAFIFFVAVIIIMNTLSMAAMERTTEIGMMRAVGARKSLISRLFLTETFLLSAAFGGGGILVGAIVVKVLAMMHWATRNEMLQIFFGGDVFRPVLQLTDIVVSVIQLLVVTGLSVLYPIWVARRITPLDAISRD
jgi:ABC-type lipoprotein release transport system permease subunit